MFEAGLAAALAGETTIEEVIRSIRAGSTMPAFRYTAIGAAGERLTRRDGRRDGRRGDRAAAAPGPHPEYARSKPAALRGWAGMA